MHDDRHIYAAEAAKRAGFSCEGDRMGSALFAFHDLHGERLRTALQFRYPWSYRSSQTRTVPVLSRAGAQEWILIFHCNGQSRCRSRYGSKESVSFQCKEQPPLIRNDEMRLQAPFASWPAVCTKCSNKCCPFVSRPYLEPCPTCKARGGFKVAAVEPAGSIDLRHEHH